MRATLNPGLRTAADWWTGWVRFTAEGGQTSLRLLGGCVPPSSTSPTGSSLAAGTHTYTHTHSHGSQLLLKLLRLRLSSVPPAVEPAGRGARCPSTQHCPAGAPAPSKLRTRSQMADPLSKSAPIVCRGGFYLRTPTSLQWIPHSTTARVSPSRLNGRGPR